MNTVEIISALKHKRKQLGLSQRELASRCHLEKSTIARIETFQTSPTLNTLELIANKLGCDLTISEKYEQSWHNCVIRSYWKNELTSLVEIKNNRVYITKLSNNPIKQFFYAHDTMDILHFSELMETRCWERNRIDIMDLLSKIGLEEYDPVEIVRKTYGISYNDSIWFDFENSNLTWEKIAPKGQKCLK